MDLTTLINRKGITGNADLNKVYKNLEQLMEALRKKKLPPEVVVKINTDIELLNNIPDNDEQLKDVVRQTHSAIIKLVKQKCRIVLKNHYRNLWMAIGIAAFGIPIGLVFDLINSHTGMLAIGLPIGLVIGMSYGSTKDKKAFEEGRQLDVA